MTKRFSCHHPPGISPRELLIDQEAQATTNHLTILSHPHPRHPHSSLRCIEQSATGFSKLVQLFAPLSSQLRPCAHSARKLARPRAVGVEAAPTRPPAPPQRPSPGARPSAVLVPVAGSPPAMAATRLADNDASCGFFASPHDRDGDGSLEFEEWVWLELFLQADNKCPGEPEAGCRDGVIDAEEFREKLGPNFISGCLGPDVTFKSLTETPGGTVACANTRWWCVQQEWRWLMAPVPLSSLGCAR